MRRKCLFWLLLLTSWTATAQTNIEKVEPMNWWVGMNNPDVQLLVYGPKIGKSNVSVKYNGVKVLETKTVESPNYLFVKLNISPKTLPGNVPLVFTGADGKSFTHYYELKARTHKGRKSFSPADVIYLLMPDRFANGDPGNDDMPGMLEKAARLPVPDQGRHGGDIKGIEAHLDYIAAMGFTAVWINPLLENNMPNYSYHGYAATDFYKIDPRFGSNDDYAAMIQTAHTKGLKVIKDVIFNHVGNKHWWMNDLPSKDWIHHKPDSFLRTNYRASTLSDPYASEQDRYEMVTGWFDGHMPDLNQRHPLLATYLIQNSIWWIEFSGLDGIRIDTQPYPYKEFMADWGKSVLSEYPDFMFVGEAWVDNVPTEAYWQMNSTNRDGYKSYLPSVTDFQMQKALNAAFHEQDGWEQGLAKLYYVLSQDFAYANPAVNVTFIDNHDLTRAFTVMGRDYRKLKLAVTFLLTSRGIPQIYYGTELLFEGDAANHGFLRADFPGGWAGDEVDAFKGVNLTPEQKEAQDFFRKLLNWRKTKTCIHSGKLTHFVPIDGIYVYFRHNDKESVMVVMNNTGEEKKVETKRFAERLKGFRSAKEVLTGQEINDLSTLSIPAKTALVFDLK